MEELKGKRLLILGGSLWKDAIKNFAQENEIVLIATGNDKKAGIFEIATEVYDIDSTDEEAMKKLIIDKKIDGVYMGGSEPVIKSATKYLNELKLPCYCTREQWDFLENKANFKKICIEHGLPVVQKYEIDEKKFEKSAGQIKFPVITKPTDACGSNGFSICNNLEQLKLGYAKAKRHSSTGEVIVEEFVKNDSVVAFYTISEGKAIFTGLEDKYPVKFDKKESYIAGMLLLQSKKTEEFRTNFEDKIQNMFQSLNLKEGSLWIEVFCNSNGYYFNEVGYRYGGSISIFPVDYYYDINQVAADIYYALTGKSKVKGFNSLISKEIKRKRNYCIYCVYINHGKIAEIKGIDKIKNCDNIVECCVTKKINDIIEDTGTFSQIFSLVHFTYDSMNELKKTIDIIDETIIVNDENGKNLVNKMLYLNK